MIAKGIKPKRFVKLFELNTFIILLHVYGAYGKTKNIVHIYGANGKKNHSMSELNPRNMPYH
jgi:hypothetical protein